MMKFNMEAENDGETKAGITKLPGTSGLQVNHVKFQGCKFDLRGVPTYPKQPVGNGWKSIGWWSKSWKMDNGWKSQHIPGCSGQGVLGSMSSPIPPSKKCHVILRPGTLKNHFLMVVSIGWWTKSWKMENGWKPQHNHFLVGGFKHVFQMFTPT